MPLDDAFSLVRLDASDIERDPGRLLDEAGTVSMFSERRLIWVRDAGSHKGFADAVKSLAAAPLADAIVLVEAGDLKKGSALSSVVEAAKTAIALPCYADDGRSIDAVIDEAHEKGRRFARSRSAPGTETQSGRRPACVAQRDRQATALCGRVGHDQSGRRPCRDRRRLEHDRRCGCRCSMLGRLGELDTAFSRFVSSGNQLFPVLNAALRQFQSLDAMRDAMDRTRSQRRGPGCGSASAGLFCAAQHGRDGAVALAASVDRASARPAAGRSSEKPAAGRSGRADRQAGLVRAGGRERSGWPAAGRTGRVSRRTIRRRIQCSALLQPAAELVELLKCAVGDPYLPAFFLVADHHLQPRRVRE